LPNKELLFGIDEIDQVFIGKLPYGSTIIIAGEPGSGKTSFAARVAYENMVKYSSKVLYINFNEDLERFLNNMAMLGMNFQEFIDKGLFKYISIPLIASHDLIDLFTELYLRNLTELRPDWIVIDSITPLLSLLDDSSIRVFFKNTIYKDFPGLRINRLLLTEIPFGSEYMSLKGIEFVADALFILKMNVVNGFIHRILEIRKARGASTYTNEIPFSIIKDEGIRFLPTPIMDKIPPISRDEIYYSGCDVIDANLGGIPKGAQVLILYPAGYLVDPMMYIILLQYVIKHRLRTLFISYSLPPSIIRKGFMDALKIIGYRDPFENNLIHIEAINPSSMGIIDILVYEYKALEKYKPELLILHGLRNVYDLHGGESIARYTYECSLIYRQRGITTFRQVAQTSKDEYHPAMEYSDIVLRIEPKIETGYTIHVLKTVEKGTPGGVITYSGLKKCFGNLHIM